MDVLERSPRLPPHTVVRRKKEKYLFLDPDKPAWVVTNANGAVALKLCDGARTVAEISRIVSKKMGGDRTGEIAGFFAHVFNGTRLFSEPEPLVHHSSGLQVVHLNLTGTCNLRCVYCYAADRVDSSDALSAHDWFGVIDAVNGLSSVVTIELTGGEPLLSPHVFDVARYAKEKGNEVHLLSNGLLITEKTAAVLAEAVDLVKISLDGSTTEIHEYHRGRGTFRAASDAIDRLVRRNVPVQVSMTVTGKNIRDIGRMVARLGAMVSFAPLFMSRGARVNRALRISGKQYYKALSSVPGVNPLSCLYSCLQWASHARVMKCAAGDAEISISSTGDVYPCHLLHLPQFLAGSLRETPLDVIYRTSRALAAVRDLDVRGIAGCAECDVRFICGGACRARAFYEKNRIDVADDFCEYEKLAYMNGLLDLHEMG